MTEPTQPKGLQRLPEIVASLRSIGQAEIADYIVEAADHADLGELHAALEAVRSGSLAGPYSASAASLAAYLLGAVEATPAHLAADMLPAMERELVPSWDEDNEFARLADWWAT